MSVRWAANGLVAAESANIVPVLVNEFRCAGWIHARAGFSQRAKRGTLLY